MRIVKKYQDGNQLPQVPYMYGADPIYYATLPQNTLLPDDTKRDLAKATAKVRMASLLPFLGLGTGVGRFLMRLTQPSTYIQKVAGLMSPITELKAASAVSPTADVLANGLYSIMSGIGGLYGIGKLVDDNPNNNAGGVADIALGVAGALGLSSLFQKANFNYPASRRLKRFAQLDENRPAFVSPVTKESTVGVHQLALDENGNPLRYENIFPEDVLQLLKNYRKPKQPYIYQGRYFDLANKDLANEMVGGVAKVGTIEYPGIGIEDVTDVASLLHEIGGHGTETEAALKPYVDFVIKYRPLLNKYRSLFENYSSTTSWEMRASAVESLLKHIQPTNNPQEFLEAIGPTNGYTYEWYNFLNNPRVKAEPEYPQLLQDFVTLMSSESMK